MATSQTQPMRLEPKTFFANERTFLSWLHMAVTLGSISAALLGFAAGACEEGMCVQVVFVLQGSKQCCIAGVCCRSVW